MSISLGRGDLVNPELFGNEAGDDEDVEVLDSYFVDKKDFSRFYSPVTKLSFVRSRKGVGKSALLKQTLYKREVERNDEILIYIKASDLVAIQDIGDSPDDLVYGWQQRICSQINREIGAALKFGFSDDSMMLIESAELGGFRNRNLVSALVDRLSVKGLGGEIERKRLEVGNSQALLKRVLDKGDARVWVFIDDVDATFVNTEYERLKTSTFFSACRNLSSTVKGLCIRASVRTDVWSVLIQYDEALDKCEQYMLDLTWSTMETGKILENKIQSYMERSYDFDKKELDGDRGEVGRVIRRAVFREPFDWGGRKLESFRPIHILSAGRPRWAAQLCKLAGRDASDKSSDKISMGNLRSALRRYGQYRISDLYKEHRHQCACLQDIIESFSGGVYRFSTQELLDHIFENVIMKIGVPKIDGVNSSEGSLSVANFLYRCGFVAARDEEDPTGLGFVRYEDRPNLLASKSNLDDGLSWEIHPSYRNVLRIEKSKS